MSNKFINPSGFTENLPAEQLVEESLKQTFATVAESYGYVRLETAAVEYMDTLASKGDINKEIYTIGRALAEGEDAEADRGLRFDLTVPFARYVAQHQNELEFPFRRFQIQKVWRGERPQKGRSREFYQADLDVVAHQTLSPFFDAEIATAMAKILDRFDIGVITMNINNRKFLNGLLESFGIAMDNAVLQAIDKLDKVGVDEVKRMLVEDQGLDEQAINKVFAVITETVPREKVTEFLSSIEGDNENLNEGKIELEQLFFALPEPDSLKNLKFVLNPRIARGLDYYTGTVYETTINGLEKYGSICSGGRYADLASRFTNQKMPGVGLSIGLTRLLAIIKEEKLMDFTKQTKSDLVICLLDEEQRFASLKAAEELRTAGINTEMNQKTKVALGKQLDSVEKRGIPYALVCEKDGNFTLYKVNGEKQILEDLNSVKEIVLGVKI